MARIPRPVRDVLDQFQNEFCDSVWQHFFAMLMVAILLRGRRTILRLHDLAVRLTPGHFLRFIASSRIGVGEVYVWRRFSPRRLLNTLAPAGVLEIVGDDTVSQHRGKRVYGKALPSGCRSVGAWPSGASLGTQMGCAFAADSSARCVTHVGTSCPCCSVQNA